jgi:hypothetical protein
VRTGCAVAVSQSVGSEGEQLIILAERDIKQAIPDTETENAIRDTVVAGISIKPYLIQMLEPGTLPRTSSGKFRRSLALQMFLSGDLVAPDNVTALKLFMELGKSQLAWAKFQLRSR